MWQLTRSGGQEERATAEFVNTHGKANRNEELEQLLTGINTSLLGLLLDTGALIDEIGVVTDQGITRVLGDDTKRDKDHEAVTVATSFQKVEIAAVGLCLVLHGNSVLHLVILELDSGIIAVTIGMVLSENVESLLGTLLGYKPAGRLRDPIYANNLDQ